MRRYFTADLHLGSNLINKYAHRPFESAMDAWIYYAGVMNSHSLPRNYLLIHAGDFMLSGTDRHGKEQETGLKISLDTYIDALRPSILLLSGNHDDNRNCETAAKSMVVDLNQNYRNVYVSHYPSYHEFYRGPDCSKWHFGRGIALCGHVHDKWLLFYDRRKNVLNINVGIDAWDYKLVEDVQITELLDFIRNARVKMPKDQMTSAEVQAWKEKDKKCIEASRAKRKMERYAKKGLTPEECQRRKEAAMKAKGLI